MFCRNLVFAVPAGLRLYSTAPPKSKIQLVAELRKLTNAPISKARQAIAESDNFDAALKWLENDLLVSGAAKAEKLKDRVSNQGQIAIHIDQAASRAAIVELSCETDFVALGSQFVDMASNIAHTLSTQAQSQSPGFQALEVDSIMDQVLIPIVPQAKTESVRDSLMTLIGKTGENITLRRATTFLTSTPGITLGSYIHNQVASHLRVGRIVGLTLLSSGSRELSADASTERSKLADSLARQVVGFNPLSVKAMSPEDEETALYTQPFAMLRENPWADRNASVRTILDQYKERWQNEEVEVLDFIRWEVGK